MRRTFARVSMSAGLVAACTAAHALGLGEIQVDSQLNQRFSATVPLTDISVEDLDSVRVTLAPTAEFDRAGLEWAQYLSSLNFTVTGDRGAPRITISSPQIAHEPVLNLLVQVRWPGGRILREYTVLLDPPILARAAPAKPPTPKPVAVAAPPPVVAAPVPARAVPPPPAPVARPEPKPEPRPESEFYETATEARAPRPAASAARSAPAPAPATLPSVAANFYGPVQPGETLWSVASRLRPDSRVTMDQMQLALVQANPTGIQRATTLVRDALLQLPDDAALQAFTPAQATARLQALRSGKAPAKPATPASAPAKLDSKIDLIPPPPAAKKLLDAPAPKAVEPAVTAAPAAAEKPIAKPSAPPAEPPAAQVAESAKPDATPPDKPLEDAPAPAPAANTPAPESVAEKRPDAPAAASPAQPASSKPADAASPDSTALPPPAKPSLAQTAPEQASGGIGSLLTQWALPLGGGPNKPPICVQASA